MFTNNLKRKLITAVTILGLLLGQVAPAIASEVPTPPAPPTAPSAPAAPTPPPAPAEPTAPPAPTPPANPFTNPNPTPNPTPVSTSTPTPTPTPRAHSTPTPAPSSAPTASPTPAPSTAPNVSATPDANDPGGQVANGQNGGSTINTGSADNSAVLANDANSNLANSGEGGGGSASVVNSGNGSDSQNSGSAQIADSNNTYQNNSANIVNDLNQDSITGQNSASKNTGGDVNITTGDANVSGTLINTVNTNAAGIAVSEFNIEDDHVGDYILDFAANCIYGCVGGATAANTGNGSGSNNDANTSQVLDNNTFQTNEANIGNDLTLTADSGNNRADRNTGGDVNVATGDANVSANALTFANNNISGEILYGVVNIYGDLVGDIIFPEEMLNSCCGGSATAANSQNGSDSTNSANATQNTTNNTVQTNLASITNNLNLDSTSGDNIASRNTDGSNSITTGNTSVDANVLNVANSNIDGGVWWLVLVNEAGQWIGKIMGAPDGANYAGSEGSEFTVNEAGEVTAVNTGNGEGSQNNSNVTQNQTNNTVQTNNVNLTNNLNLAANTGGNSASRNTGGNSSVVTGDAQIMANLVNFVNNNITGGGKLVVTVVNVFGSWLGDFVGPGQHQDQSNNQANIGGAAVDTNSNSNSNSNNSNNNGGSSPTPTPTSNPVAKQGGSNTTTGSVLAATSVSSNGNGDNETDLMVAAFNTNVSDDGFVDPSQVLGKRTLHINLAWILLILPAGGIFVVTRKKLLARTA